jgi:RNA polymerase sigma factor (TIGR02999 family)
MLLGWRLARGVGRQTLAVTVHRMSQFTPVSIDDGSDIPPAMGASSGGAQVTQLLWRAADGDASAARDLMPLIYEQLRELARRRMGAERPDHTLAATALVHEAYLRLVGDRSPRFAGRAHFYHAAAEAMQRILVEHARARGRVKRGGGAIKLSLSVIDLAQEADSEEILALHEAIGRLEERDATTARVVRLRFFAGLTVEETAEAMELSPRTVKREWALARAWLYQALRRDLMV